MSETEASETEQAEAADGPPEEESEVAWRCLRAKPKCEHLAAAQLRIIGEVDVYCPRIRFQRRTRRGKVWFVEALFPGYVFCRFDLREHLRRVNATHNVTGVLRFGDEYAELEDATIEQLRREFPEDAPVSVVQTLSVGDEVEVVSGPLRGASARVTSIPSAHDRVRILLEFLGQEREVEVPLVSLLGFRSARVTTGGSS